MQKNKSYLVVLITSIFLLVSCTEKPKANVQLDKNLTHPIACMRLNNIAVEKEFLDTLNHLYTFDKNCSSVLHMSYKKNIVCNSSHNSVAKSTGKFPKSFLKLELRKGLQMQYSYYIDLLDNVDRQDVREAFRRLSLDIL